MFNIALTLVLSGDDDGQTVFFAKPVRSVADKRVPVLMAGTFVIFPDFKLQG